jgi:anti-anti-sigma factor
VDDQGSASPVVVTLPDELDMTSADAISDLLRSAFVPGVAVVIADMTRTSFGDKSCSRRLAHAHDYAGASGAQLRLVIRPGLVRRVLWLLGLDRSLAVYPNLVTPRTGD